MGRTTHLESECDCNAREEKNADAWKEQRRKSTRVSLSFNFTFNISFNLLEMDT